MTIDPKYIKQRERATIMRKIKDFSDLEENDNDMVSELLSDLIKFIREGKREYLKNSYKLR
jgi:hypothetical protein